MKATPKRSASLTFVGGLLSLTISFGLVAGFGYLAGVARPYALAFVVGGVLLFTPFLVYSVLRAARGNPVAVPVNLFEGRFGVVAFWAVGLLVFIPGFSLVASTLPRQLLEAILAAAPVPGASSERVAVAVLLVSYVTSVVCGALLWHWAWQQFKRRHGAA